MSLADYHIEFIVKRCAENLPLQEIVREFKQVFASDLPDDPFANLDKWLYWRVVYYQHSKRRAQKWKDLYNDHYRKWRTEIDDSLYLTQKNARLREREKEYFQIEDMYADKVLEVDDGTKIVVYKRNTDAKLKTLRHIQEELEPAGIESTSVDDSELDTEGLRELLSSYQQQSGDD